MTRKRTRNATHVKPRRPRISKHRLEEMIEAATVDCYNESEQTTGWFTMIDENLAVPFETTVLGVPVTVERVDMDRSEQIVAVCSRGRDVGRAAGARAEREEGGTEASAIWGGVPLMRSKQPAQLVGRQLAPASEARRLV